MRKKTNEFETNSKYVPKDIEIPFVLSRFGNFMRRIYEEQRVASTLVTDLLLAREFKCLC